MYNRLLYNIQLPSHFTGVWYNITSDQNNSKPRRACAARVTVVVLCACLFVCLSATILALQATRRLMSDTNRFSATRAGKRMWRFRWNHCVREIWRENKQICIMSTGLPRPGLARSAHRGRMKLLRGYVYKSSAALNPLTITQLAWELRWACIGRDGVAWPIPSIFGAHAHYRYYSTAHAYTFIACV